ncbi:hypothetical protein KJ603_01435 [Patescibacteria group bacterium]|nr:hypothetical protein [Patescibacteria group bacterium]
MITLFGVEVNVFNILVVAFLTYVFYFFANNNGYTKCIKEWRGISAETLRKNCVYQITHRVKENPLTIILKEKTPNGIEER